MLELWAAVQPDAGDADDSELDRQDIALLAVGIVARCAQDGANRAVGECFGIEVCGVNGGVLVPQTDRILDGNFVSPEEFSTQYLPPSKQFQSYSWRDCGLSEGTDAVVGIRRCCSLSRRARAAQSVDRL